LIILQRITGLENSLLGFTSRIQPIIMSGKFELDDFSAIDVICFGTILSSYNFLKIWKKKCLFYLGHVLFEMAAGYELLTPEPSEINLRDIAHYPQVRKSMRKLIHIFWFILICIYLF